MMVGVSKQGKGKDRYVRHTRGSGKDGDKGGSLRGEEREPLKGRMDEDGEE